MSGKATKIEEIYYNLTKQEKEEIAIFLECSLYNNSVIVSSIHRYLSEHLILNSDLDKPSLYGAVFPPNEKYSDLKLRVFITKLSKLIEKYIIVKHIDDYPMAELSILNQYYRTNHLHKNYTVFFNGKSEKEFDSYEEFLMYEYVFSLRKLDYIYQEHSNDGDKIRIHFDQMLEAQQKLSFFQTLKTQCEFLSFAQKYKNERDNTNVDSVINQLIDNRHEQDPVFKAYIFVFLLSKEQNEESFQELYSIILNKEIKFISNYRAILTHSQNFCIRFINSGKSEYLTYLFEIYKLGLPFYLVAGDLTSAGFRNIAQTALKLGNIGWAEDFVEKYYLMVSLDDQQNSYNFNYSRIYFERKDYKSAMRLLLRVSYEDSFYATSGRLLLIKCYYELNDEMPLVSCCGSLSQFLHRNKDFTKLWIENNLHFIKFVKTIQNNRLKINKSYFKNLKEKIESSTVVEKDWLLKKIDEISK